MSDLHSGENRRITELDTNELERILWEDAVRRETDPEDVDALFEVMQELASRQGEEPADTKQAYASFKARYLPCADTEESLYTQQKSRKRTRLFRVLRSAAAAAAVLAFGLLISDAFGLKLWNTLPETPEGKLPGAVDSVAIPDAEGREVAVGTVSIDRYGIRASIEEKDTKKRSYEVSVNYSFYTDNAARINEYWTVIGDPITTGSESVILQEFSGNGYSNLRSAEVTFRELSSEKSVPQSLVCVYPVFE